MELSPIGQAALLYAADLGWPVFPVHSVADSRCSCGNRDCASPGKHPRTPNGCHDASQHPEQIGCWWDRWPNASIGLATGRGSAITVLDIDGPEGEESLTDLLVTLGIELPPTILSTTGKGRHLLYADRLARLGCSQDVLGDGIDVRGEGGYVVLPPSPHYTGRTYQWARAGDFTPAPIPDVIVEEHERRRDAQQNTTAPVRWGPTFGVTDRKRWQRATAYTTKLPSGLSDGRKRATFVYSAFLLHECGIATGDAFELVAAWNRDNTPPLKDRVLERTFQNALRYGGRRRGAK